MVKIPLPNRIRRKDCSRFGEVNKSSPYPVFLQGIPQSFLNMNKKRGKNNSRRKNYGNFERNLTSHCSEDQWLSG